MEFSMRILLSPNPNKQPAELGDLYTDALSQAEELYLATAYLTDWNTAYKLNKACRQVTFLVGTDFGLTRKKAILDVLRWLPQDIGVSFLAIPQQDSIRRSSLGKPHEASTTALSVHRTSRRRLSPVIMKRM
jgi:hypothetical protein